MSAGNTFENDLAKFLYNRTPIANIADDAVTSPLTDWYLSLHTADPGEGGSQTTSEISYTGYARVAVARSVVGFTVTGGNAALASNVPFGPMTAGAGGIVTHIVVGTASSGAGKIIVSGLFTPNLNVVVGITPIATTATVFGVE